MPENPKNTMPLRGKVQKVKKEFMVHEDAGYAYQLQNEEIDKHYGLNRYNRRTVREDIPIAKVVQNDEEARQQEERFQQLQALRAQAEEDERVAKSLMQQELIQNQAQKIALELTDEEYAKNVQEEEKRKYEKHLEKKKQRKLKKEREEIERTQQQRSEEARLAVPVSSGGSSEDLDSSVGDLQVNNLRYMYRVTPTGRIEDDGDFSDFYNLPNNLDPNHRQFLQEVQDEELAKLIQEQEHKRSKAQVDKEKLKEIEEQDRRLAQIIQEQEKLKLRRAKQKKKQQEEARRAQEAAQKPPALPPRNNEHNHRKYRRNSFIMSMENGPDDGEGEAGQRQSQASSEEYLTPLQVSAEQRLQQGSERLRAQGSERLRSQQSSEGPRSEQVASRGDIRLGESAHSRQISSEVTQNRSNMSRLEQTREKNVRPEELPVQNVPDVERWLAGQNQNASTRGRLRSDRSDSEHYPDSSSPGSYHSDESFPHGHTRSPVHNATTETGSHHAVHNTTVETGSHYAVSDPFNFNIAAAIDPTYTQRRQGTREETDRKQPAQPLSRSLPVDERTLSTMSSTREQSFHDDMPGVVSPFAPVQGQRRTVQDKNRKSRKSSNPDADAKQKGNCKQQ